jgi:hypothetical protein
MRLVARFAFLGAVFFAGLVVLAFVVKPDLPGFMLAGAVFVVLSAVLDRLMLSRFLGRPTSDRGSSDIPRR